MQLTEFLEAKRYRLELVLLGMALGSKAARDRITESIDGQHMIGSLNRKCLQSLKHDDRAGVRSWVASLGVKIDNEQAVVDAIIADVIRRCTTSHLQFLLLEANINMDDADALRTIFAKGLEVVGKSETEVQLSST